MNDILQQLLAMGPGLGAGLSGNGNAMQAFMQSYQQTSQMLAEKKRRQQADALALEDRKRAIGRQTDADKYAAEARARAGTVDKQQDFIRGQQAQGALVETAGGMDDPDAAKRYIESMMPNLMAAFGQESMALGQPAVERATQVITGRQKKQVSDFVESALKIEHIANNPDADPEITNLPAHIVKVIGKPSAKLSELQTFAQLPVGKPQGKTRTPAAAGSFEDYVEKAYGPNATAEQILAARKAYQQSDDRPRITVNTGGVDSRGMARFNSIASAYDRSPLIRAADRTLILDDATKNIRKDPQNAAAQMALAYGYIQALDTYQSAVREGELGNLGSLGTVAQQLAVSANKLITTGAFMPPEVALQIANSADQLVQVIERGRQQKMAEFASRAKVNKVEDMWAEFVAGMPQRAQAATQDTAAKPKFQIGQKVRNKNTGEIREVTGVRPDGSPILSVVKPQ